VGHDHAPDHAGGHAPAGGVTQGLGAVRGGVGDVEGRREVRAQVVAGAGLQSAPVAHHAFDREGLACPGEPLARRLLAWYDRHRGDVACHLLVEVQRGHHLRDRTGLVGVRGVPLLPEELRGAQEQPRAQLPAHHVCPLVEQQRQVTVADDRLRRRPHDERLLQLLAAGLGHHRKLGGEALHVVGLAAQVGLGDEQREVGVVVARGLDPRIELGDQQLPDPVAVWADDHRSLDRSAVGQLRLDDELVVPGGEVLGLRGDPLLALLVRGWAHPPEAIGTGPSVAGGHGGGPAGIAQPCGRSTRSAARAVQPVWWLAPSPAPVSPWKYSWNSSSPGGQSSRGPAAGG
jgi:hypothetical protein